MGCGRCRNTGYNGRFAVYEYIIMNADLRRQMATNPMVFAREQRLTPRLRNNAFEALQTGRTTAEEVIKSLHHDG